MQANAGGIRQDGAAGGHGPWSGAPGIAFPARPVQAPEVPASLRNPAYIFPASGVTMFSISEFIRVNRTALIWLAFALLLYMFRSIFGLVFVTFVMCFLVHGITRALRRRFRVNRKVLVVAVFLVFSLGVAAFLRFIPPRLFSEAVSFSEQIPSALQTIRDWVDVRLGGNEMVAPVIEHLKGVLKPERTIVSAWGIARAGFEKGLHYGSWFFLAMLFSFLIMLDLPQLMRSVRSLRYTRLAEPYKATSGSIAMFARVVGENFRAQLIVSAVNTTLTAIGLYFLDVKAAVLLCTLVFLCGLIPVLGVFISSVPVILMAINSGGIETGLWALGLIIAIHLLEAYVLNPRIVSSVMHINPVMTLIILYIAHSLMGFWGMLLGVPIAVYIWRNISMPR
ncbi:MAG: AI-2E family transporter, partial [Mailhella sp.]|nr:AI-2E family transporter [Mailhella sp.]